MTDTRANNDMTDGVETNTKDTAAKVLRDQGADTPGGGGLGGTRAADHDAMAERAGGTAPDAPIDTNVDSGTADAAREARAQAARDVPEPK